MILKAARGDKLLVKEKPGINLNVNKEFESCPAPVLNSKNDQAVTVKQPIADIFFVESYKDYNYGNTDRTMGKVSFIERATDMASEKCTIF